MRKALIAMSGGVDSSAAALLMQRAGFECLAATMRLQDSNGEDKHCAISADAADAKAVADALGMPFYLFDEREEFSRCVLAQFVSEYRADRTPNPCIRCNRCMKFGRLLTRAEELRCDVLATGHYARIQYDESRQRWLLLRAKNRAKDQSYFLYFLTQEQLARIRFPLGEYESKDAVRALAAECGMSNARKKDSQDICFVPDGDYVAFLRSRGVTLTPGDFVDRSGQVLGRHEGLEAYTTGQRKGLGVSGGKRLYVIRKDAVRNTVLLGDDADLFSRTLTAGDVNWISMETPAAPIRVTAKTRYSQTEAAATVTALRGGRIRVDFDTPQRAITAGQAVVLYDGEEVVGGGTIEGTAE